MSSVGAVIINFSAAVDYILYDLRVAKIHAYRLSINAVTFLYYYLKGLSYKSTAGKISLSL